MTYEEWLKSKSPEWIITSMPDVFLKTIWRDATLAERERCAKVAEDCFDEERLFEGVRFGGTMIAAAIRSGVSDAQ